MPEDAISSSTSDVNFWELLPDDLKQLVLGQLSYRDLAMAARTCRDFSQRVQHGRMNAKLLVIPTGMLAPVLLWLESGIWVWWWPT